MTTPLENLPAKPIRFVLEGRISAHLPWFPAGDTLAPNAEDAVRQCREMLFELPDNVRCIGITYLVPVEDSANKS